MDEVGEKINRDATSSPSKAEHEIESEKRAVESNDIGGGLYAEVQQIPTEELEAESAAVLRMLDWRIMPIICVTYTIQFLDKLSLNYASAYSLKEDLGLVGQRYSWVAAIFNFGYLFWALPANLLIQRLPVAKYTGSMIFLWAILLIAHIGAKNYGGILVLRFLLGMFEASISPAIMAIVSMFYTRSEQPLRMCVFLAFNGMATMIGALLGYGLGHATSSALKPWKLIFLVIGLLNLVWSLVFLYVMPDSPADARFLTHRQKLVAIHRVSKNMIGVKTKEFKSYQAVEALIDVKVIAIALIGLGCGVINGGVSNFASALIKGYGFTGINTSLLQLPTGAFEFFLVPLCGLAASYFKDVRCLVLMIICLPPLGGLIGIRLTSLDHRWTLVGCTWLQFLIGAPVILSWNLLTSNIGGHTKRSFANGMWFMFYAGGNIAGANIFFTKEAPRYFSALTGLITCYVGLIVIAGSLWAYMLNENHRRNKLAGDCVEKTIVDSADPQAILDGFGDRTDKENVNFRYCL
jgi:MFS family permease